MGRGADEGNARLLAGARQLSFLGEKAVAGMNGVDVLSFCQRDDPCSIQVRFYGTFAGTHLIGLVGLEAVQGQPVFLRIDGHGAQAKLIGGAKNADGDFAAVGSQQFADWFLFPLHGGGALPKFYIVPPQSDEPGTVFSMREMQRFDESPARVPLGRRLSRAERRNGSLPAVNQGKFHRVRIRFRTADTFQKSTPFGRGLVRRSSVAPEPAVTSVARADCSSRSCARTFTQALAVRFVAYGASGSA